MQFRFERTWLVAMGVDELWAVLEDTSSYPKWWPWLREAELPALAPGNRARFAVAAPLPYRMNLELEVTDVDRGKRIGGVLDGDLVGRAELRIAADGDGSSQATLAWDLDLQRPLMRALGLIGRGVLEAGHEWVVRAGVRQFAVIHGIDVHEIAPAHPPLDGDRPPSRSAREIVTDGLVAGAVAGIVSGAPSALVTLARRQPLLASTRAAGTLLGAPTIPRGLVAHGVVSLGWGVVLSALLEGRRDLPSRVVAGAAAGAAIAALDLGVVARHWFPTIDRLERPRQTADHVLYGAVVGAAVGWRRG